MLKEAIQYLLELKKPEVVDVDGVKYSTINLSRISAEASVSSIHIRNLQGIVDYVKSQFDTERKMAIHIESPTTVSLFDQLNSSNHRRTYLEAKALLPNITFNRHQEREEFQVMLQSCFVKNSDKELALKLISSLVENEGVSMQDNGIAQEVQVKKGISLKETVLVPETFSLKPYRTFVEVEQPGSDFILRIKEGARAALFEADGGAWELNAMNSIKQYFQEELKEEIEKGLIYIIA